MTKARPNALSLAVTVAISSSIISTQALADRKLQIKSADILGNGHAELTHSEVMIRPTLGPDEQPIPKSYTTTYPYEPEENEVCLYNSLSFADAFYNTPAKVSSVDLFETDENNVAQKYTKVLKAGDEGVFRFTHNLEETELVIEVRGGMTDRDTIEDIRNQWQSLGIKGLEPSTKIANPLQLADLLEAADNRAGNLGSSEHYVPLATIEVGKIEVQGRTFMRLIASGDQPPELQRLGQSIFVNDDALLLAAASAYIQVHVLEEDLQQQALNELLAHSKPVGYVVHVENDKRVYPVPEGYPKLEVSEIPGEVIVFHGQKLNPHDIAVVESIHNLWQQAQGDNPTSGLTTKIRKWKVESYQYVIRSRQMAVLEELVARQNTAVNEGQGTLAGEDNPETPSLEMRDRLAIRSLAYYESLHQALAIAASDQADEVEFTLKPEHIKIASSFITPTWLQMQLAKHFSFKPVLRNLLNKQHFVQNMLDDTLASISKLLSDFIYNDEDFADKIRRDLARQLIEVDNKLEGLQLKEAKLVQLKNQLQQATERADASDKEKQETQYRYQDAKFAYETLRRNMEELESQKQKLDQEVKQIPKLEQQLHDARLEARKTYNSELAAMLGIDDWDDTQPPEGQARRLLEKINDMRSKVIATYTAPETSDEEALQAKPAAFEGISDTTPINEEDLSYSANGPVPNIDKTLDATGRSSKEAAKAKPAAIEGRSGITPVNENDLIYNVLGPILIQDETLLERANPEQILAPIERGCGLVPVDKADLKARVRAIKEHIEHVNHPSYLRQQDEQANQQTVQQQSTTRTEAEKAAATKARLALIASHLNMPDFDGNTDIDTQQKLLVEKIKSLNALTQKLTKLSDDQQSEIKTLREENTRQEEDIARLRPAEQIHAIKFKLMKPADLEAKLESLRTPRHIVKPEVLWKLGAVEKALKMDDFGTEDDVYYRRNAISEALQTSITKFRQRAEEDALKVLKTAEEIFEIKVNEGDDNRERLHRIRAILDGDDVTEKKLDDIENALSKEEFTSNYETTGTKPGKLHELLTFFVEDADERVLAQQTSMLKTAEDELGIVTSKNLAAIERGKDSVAKLAEKLKVDLIKDASLEEQKGSLINRIQTLKPLVGSLSVDEEGVKRYKNNHIAHVLDIEDYRDDAPIDDQINRILEKLAELEAVANTAGQPDTHERIEAIDAELDRQIARLGPKPRYTLDREVARARRAVADAESELKATYRKLENVRRKREMSAGPADVHPITDEDKTTPNQVMKKLQANLGLTPVDKQTTEDRVNDIRDLLQGEDSEKQYEIAQQLKAATSELKISVDGDPDRLAEEDYFNAIMTHADTYGQDEVDYPAGELPETRRKYAQVTKFLHEHALRVMEMTQAQDEEKQAQEELNTINQAIDHSKDSDPKAKTKLEDERDVQALVLKQKRAVISEAQEDLEAHVATLRDLEDNVGLKPDPTAHYTDRVDALRNKQLELGGDDGSGGKILQLTGEQDTLNREIEVRKSEIDKLKKVLHAAEEAAENEGGPFQYTPGQARILADLHAYMQSHSLKKQALEAVIGLSESAELNGKSIPNLQTFDLDDEFAPIRLQALAGDNLPFNQASRIVEVFKDLKATFTFELAEDQSLNPLEEVQMLASRARIYMNTGAQQFDDEIHGIGEAAIRFIEHEPEGLKSFSEYFATHSASGHRIITLLREGLISKVELEHYMKAVRGVDGYQLVDEFEHFIGYKHGVRVPEFRKVVQMLSDKGAEEFMQSAFTPVTVTTNGPAGMKESFAGMKEYAASVIANYVLDDIAFENGRRTAAFLTNVQDTLTPYANAVGLSESDLIKIIHSTLMQTHAAAVEQQLNDYWIKPSAFLAQAVTWYYSSYKPLLVTHTALQAARLSLSNMAFLYLLDLTNRGDYTHRMLTPFQHWLERYSVDLDRTRQYAYHSGIEQVAEVGGLAMPFGKAASSVILLKTGSMLFNRQYNANPRMYRNLYRLVPEMVKSMGSGQGVQVPLLHRITPEKVKTLASATAGLVLGPVATVGAYTHGLISGFTYAQTFGLALASSLTFDFFMNDNKMLTQWLGGPLGRSLDKLNRWRGAGETESDYVKRTAIATPQRFGETDKEYADRVKANHMMHGWTRKENYLQFRERRDRTMKMYENGWERYFRENVPKWSFSHAKSVPYSYTLGAFYKWQEGSDKKVPVHHEENAPQSSFLPSASGNLLDTDEKRGKLDWDEWENVSEATTESATTGIFKSVTNETPVITPSMTFHLESAATTPTATPPEVAMTSVAKTLTSSAGEASVTSQVPSATPGVTAAPKSTTATSLTVPEVTPTAKVDDFEEDEIWEDIEPQPLPTSTSAPLPPSAAVQPKQADPKSFDFDEDWGDIVNTHNEL